MSKPVCRLERVASRQAIAALARHWFRTQPTPNADHNMSDGVKLLHGSGNVLADVSDQLGQLTKPPRKDACLAVEVLLSASEDYFRPTGGAPYARDAERIEAFARASLAHLQREFGHRLAAAVLHLDEQTPHVHALVVPLEAKFRIPAGRTKDRTPRETLALNANGLLGSRDTLRGYQERYEVALTPLGVGPRTRKKLGAPSRTTITGWYARQEIATETQERAAEAAAVAQAEAAKSSSQQTANLTMVEAVLDGRVAGAHIDPSGHRQVTFSDKLSPLEQSALAVELRPSSSAVFRWAVTWLQRLRDVERQERAAIRERLTRQEKGSRADQRLRIASLRLELKRLWPVLEKAHRRQAAIFLHREKTFSDKEGRLESQRER